MNEKPPPRKLTRSRSNRYIGGVAAGIADRLKVEPVFVRIAFIASLIFGGLGLIAYLVLLAVMPVEGDPSEPMPPIEPKRRNQMIGLAVIVGALCLFTMDSGSGAAWIFGFWPGTVFGIFFWVIVSGVALWLIANGTFSRDPEDPGSDPAAPASVTTPASVASPAEAEAMAETSEPETSETVTFAESPTQVSPTRVMPASDPPVEDSPPRNDSDRKSDTDRTDVPAIFGRIMLWTAIGLGALTVFCVLFVVSAGVTAVFGGVPMAALVILLGGGMVFAALKGRRQLSVWLLTAAIAVTLPMAAVSIADLRIEGSYGDINETPLSVIDIPEHGYEMAAGNMTIDLRKFDFNNPRQRDLELQVKGGMGLTSIIVPDEICVVGEVTGKAGVISLRGRQSNGIDVRQTGIDTRDQRPGAPSNLVLDGDFKLGAFEVVDNTQWRQDGRGGSFAENDLEPDRRASANARERASQACSTRSATRRTAAGKIRH